MIANNFKFPKGFEPKDLPEDLSLEHGPTFEEVDEDDLD